MRINLWFLLTLVSVVGGCIWQEDPYELTKGRFRGSYRVFYPDEQQAKQEQERLLKKLHAYWGPEERAKDGRSYLKANFYRWRQDDDHLRIDLYIEDLSKLRFENGTGFRLSLDSVDDVGGLIQRKFNNPKPGDRHYDVYHDSRVMGEWTGWHWGETKKDAFKRLKDAQEREWELGAMPIRNGTPTLLLPIDSWCWTAIRAPTISPRC